jgi:hypothetical protein
MDLNHLKELLNSTSQIAGESEETEAFQDKLDGEPFSFFSFPMAANANANAAGEKKKNKHDKEEEEDNVSEVTSITFSDDSMDDDDDDSMDSEDAVIASPPRHKRRHKKSPSPAPSLSTSLVTAAAAAATAGALIESKPAVAVPKQSPGSSWKLSLMIVLAVVAGLYVIFQLKKTINQLEDDLRDEKALQLSESDIEKIIAKKMMTSEQIEKLVQQQLETKFEYVEEETDVAAAPPLPPPPPSPIMMASSITPSVVDSMAPPPPPPPPIIDLTRFSIMTAIDEEESAEIKQEEEAIEDVESQV